jgi:putative Ca2+/H+ antiporter (TMEM165/GDT1 family)
MAASETIALVLIGVVVILLPLVVIAVYAGKLSPARRTAFLVVYCASVGVVVADAAEWLSSKIAVDLVLLVGGFAFGVYVTRFFPRR